MRFSWLFLIAMLLGVALQSHGASASLLFAGGEDVDFTCASSGTCGVTTASPTFRAGWARESYGVNGNSADPPANRFATPVFSASSVIWVHAQYCQYNSSFSTCNNTGTTSNYQMLRVFDDAGNPSLIVRGTGTAQQVKVSSRNAAGTFTDLVTCPSIVTSALSQIDVYINYGSAGEVALYANGIKECDYTGDVTNGDGATTLQQLELSDASNNVAAYWSEVIVATTDTRAMSRFSATTVANGNATGFSGTNICSAIWNAAAFNDANYGYSGTPGISQECTANGSIPAGSYSVLGLVMSARALVGTTGPQHFDFLTSTGGADYASPDYAPLPTFSNIGNYVQTVNPATSAPWSVSDFSTGFNVGEKTAP